MIIPPLSALLSESASAQIVSHFAPVLGTHLFDQLEDDLVFLLGPWSLGSLGFLIGGCVVGCQVVDAGVGQDG